MFLGGLWHGAGWTFIFWGVLHGVFICINHLWRKTKIQLPKFLCWLLTFNAVNLAWIFFRANSFEGAMNIVRAMFDVSKFVVPYSNGFVAKYFELFKSGTKIMFSLRDMALIVFCLAISLIVIKKSKIEKVNLYVSALLLSALFLFAVFSMGRVTEFLYFQF